MWDTRSLSCSPRPGGSDGEYFPSLFTDPEMLHSLERYNKRERDLRLPLLLIAEKRSGLTLFPSPVIDSMNLILRLRWGCRVRRLLCSFHWIWRGDGGSRPMVSAPYCPSPRGMVNQWDTQLKSSSKRSFVTGLRRKLRKHIQLTDNTRIESDKMSLYVYKLTFFQRHGY